MNSTRSLDEILEYVARQACELLASDAAAIYMRDRNQPELIKVVAAHLMPDELRHEQVRLGEPMIGLSVERQRPVFLADLGALLRRPVAATVEDQLVDCGTYIEVVKAGPATARDPSLNDRNQVIAMRFTSSVSVPIVVQGEARGAVVLEYVQPRAMDAQTIRLITAFADQAALAIENARLHAEAEQRLGELQALYWADSALHRSLQLNDVLNALTEVASTIMQSQKSAVFIWDETRQVWTVGAARGASPEFIQQTYSGEEPFIQRSVHGGGASVADVYTDPQIPAELRHVFDYQGIRSFINAPIYVSGEVFGVFAVAYETPRAFTGSDRRTLQVLAQRAAQAIDNARLHASADQRLRELQALYNADQTLHRSLRLDDVLQALVDMAAEVLEADKSSVLVWNADHTHLVPGATRGFQPESVAQMVHAPGEGVTTVVALTGQPVVVQDATQDPRVAHRITGPEGIRSLMHVPIRIGGEVFGVFGINYCQPHLFTDSQRRLLEALAQRAGVAIQNARLYEQAQQAAALEERQRLARELHDAVTQSLFSASLIAEVAPRLWEVDREAARKRLDDLRLLTRGALAEMRALLLELRPDALLETRLDQLLRQLAEATVSRTGLRIEVSTSFGKQLPATIQVGLYRLAQEALNNVIKHARAEEVDLALRQNGDQLELMVSDDGQGFDASRVGAGRLGLRIMRERSEAIGATLVIETRPGAGTCICVRLPLPVANGVV